MKDRDMTTVILLFLLVPLAAIGGTGEKSINISDLMSHIEFLASPELEGREAGYHGSEVAARYIATMYKKYGLTSPEGAADYYQQAPLIMMRPDFENTVITLSKEDGQRSFVTDTEVFFFPKGGDNDDFSASLVFCGYGITAPEYKYDDYEGAEVQGKVVLIMNREPQENDTNSVFNGIRNTKYSIPMVKARIAKQNGAKALLIIEQPGKAPIEESLEKYRERLKKPIVQLSGKTESLPVFYLTAEAAQEILAGKVDLGEYHAGIERELKGNPIELGGIRLDLKIRFRERLETQAPNVAGILEGSDPKLKDEYLIIGAHYDHEGIGDEGFFPGADDNASGVAVLLELAEAFSSLKKGPKRSILFISFGAEEQGTLGSLYYTLNPLLPTEKATAMFNMDEVGRNGAANYRGMFDRNLAEQGTNLLMFFYTAQTPALEEMASEANKGIGLDIDFDANTSFYGNSDHVHFHDLKIPSVFFFTGFHPDYTKPSDTPDKINYAKTERIGKLIYGTAEEILNAGEKLYFDESIKEVKNKKKRMSF